MKFLTTIEFFSTRFRRVFRSTALVVLLLAVGVGTATRATHDHNSLTSAQTTADATLAVHASEPGNATASLAIQNEGTPIVIGSEHITLRRTGFDPFEFTRPAIPFLLAIDNATGMGDMSFSLLHASGARLRDFPAKGRFRLQQNVELPPGRYAVVEINHPDWLCHITITAP